MDFYFSDKNLKKDKFLSSQIALSIDGFVPIQTIVDFNRMKSLKATVEDIKSLTFYNSQVEGDLIRKKVRK